MAEIRAMVANGRSFFAPNHCKIRHSAKNKKVTSKKGPRCKRGTR